MMAASACAPMDVLIFRVLSALLTPPQMPAGTETNAIRDVELKRVLVLTNLGLNNATMSGRWGRVRGGLCRRDLQALVLLGWRRRVTEEQ